MSNKYWLNVTALFLITTTLMVSIWGSYNAEWRLRDLQREVTDMTVGAMNHRSVRFSQKIFKDLQILLSNRELKARLSRPEFPNLKALITGNIPLPADIEREAVDHLYRNILNYTESQLRMLEIIEILLAGSSIAFSLTIFGLIIHSLNQEKLSSTLKGLNRRHQEELEELKNTISAEIHDKIIQDLALIRIGLESENSDHSQLNAEVEKIISNLRRLISTVQPWDTQSIGVIFSLEMMCKKYAQTSNLRILTTLPLEEELHLSTRAKLHIIRILQELLSNAVRHSGASLIQITLKPEKYRLIITLIDNGKGFKPESIRSRDSFGILSLQQRVENIGGECHFDSRSGSGTRIRLILPMESADE